MLNENAILHCFANGIKMFSDLPEEEWDGDTPLYSDLNDTYYSDFDEAEGDLEEGQTLQDLKLMPCVPEYVPPLTIDYLEDILPDPPHDIIPKEVEDAMDAFNLAVDGIVISWFPKMARIKLHEF